MKFIENTIYAAPLLERSIHHEIVSSIFITERACHPRSPQEPDYIAGLVIDFVPELFQILKTLHPAVLFSVTGIYCHQKPTVSHTAGKGCELGDILFVHIHTDEHGRKHRNALLFQAKMSTTAKKSVPTAEHVQLELYQSWPHFTYARAGAITGQTRSVQPKAAHDGAQYMLIDSAPAATFRSPGHFPIGCAYPDSELVIDRTLSAELVDFFRFKAGRPFGDRATTGDDWTTIIWDLLDLARKATSKRAHSGRGTFSRSQHHTSASFSLLFPDIQDNREKASESIDNEQTPSVSVIAIESSVNLG